MFKVLIEKLVYMIEETISNVKDITVNVFWKNVGHPWRTKGFSSKHCKMYACFRVFWLVAELQEKNCYKKLPKKLLENTGNVHKWK